MKAVYALYSTPDSAQAAWSDLRAAGIDADAITVVSSEPFEDYEFGDRHAATWMYWIGGALALGLLGYLLAVRRHGPAAMAGVLAGALAAALITRWTGEQYGLAAFHHLLATLPRGARLRDSLSLRATPA